VARIDFYLEMSGTKQSSSRLLILGVSSDISVGMCVVALGNEYRAKAADLFAKAAIEANAETQVEMETVARSYLRLAEQADRNSMTDIVYVTPPTPGITRPEQIPPPEESREA
jgi:hypothetical protein